MTCHFSWNLTMLVDSFSGIISIWTNCKLLYKPLVLEKSTHISGVCFPPQELFLYMTLKITLLLILSNKSRQVFLWNKIHKENHAADMQRLLSIGSRCVWGHLGKYDCSLMKERAATKSVLSKDTTWLQSFLFLISPSFRCLCHSRENKLKNSVPYSRQSNRFKNVKRWTKTNMIWYFTSKNLCIYHASDIGSGKMYLFLPSFNFFKNTKIIQIF